MVVMHPPMLPLLQGLSLPISLEFISKKEPSPLPLSPGERVKMNEGLEGSLSLREREKWETPERLRIFAGTNKKQAAVLWAAGFR